MFVLYGESVALEAEGAALLRRRQWRRGILPLPGSWNVRRDPRGNV
jgi:hypothetical protein